MGSGEEMEFELTSQQSSLRTDLRQFAERELRPGASMRDREGEFPVEEVRKLQQMGIFGLIMPVEYGGMGRDMVSYAVAIEEIARQDASVAVTIMAHTLCARHISAFGTPFQKEIFLRPLASGVTLGAWALTEPGAGSDASAITTRGDEVDGEWIISGNKFLITNGSRANTLVVMASTDKSLGAKGISAFIIPSATPGLKSGRNLEKMGFRSSDTVALSLRDVRLPAEHILGDRNRGFVQAMKMLSAGRIGVAAMAVGICRGCLEESIAYARRRHTFGKPIAEHQAIQWMIADMAAELEAARLLTLRAAWKCDRGEPFSSEASMAKLFSAEAASRAAAKAVQIHGGSGYTSAFPVERYLREAKMCEIGEGTSEIQRMIIAREILKETASP
jgi:alkylation response protein AidB-like acyl-CoA dehydrogenase